MKGHKWGLEAPFKTHGIGIWKSRFHLSLKPSSISAASADGMSPWVIANNRDHLTSHHCLQLLLRALSPAVLPDWAPPHPHAQGALSSTWQGRWCSGHQPASRAPEQVKKRSNIDSGQNNYSCYQFKSVCYDATVIRSGIKNLIKLYGLLKNIIRP